MGRSPTWIAPLPVLSGIEMIIKRCPCSEQAHPGQKHPTGPDRGQCRDRRPPRVCVCKDVPRLSPKSRLRRNPNVHTRPWLGPVLHRVPSAGKAAAGALSLCSPAGDKANNAQRAPGSATKHTDPRFWATWTQTPQGTHRPDTTLNLVIPGRRQEKEEQAIKTVSWDHGGTDLLFSCPLFPDRIKTSDSISKSYRHGNSHVHTDTQWALVDACYKSACRNDQGAHVSQRSRASSLDHPPRVCVREHVRVCV